MMDTFEGFRRMRREPFAFHCRTETASFMIPMIFTPREICDIRQITFRRNTFNGVVVAKDSPFRDVMARNWMWMVEVGLWQRHVQAWQGKHPKCILPSHFTSVKFAYVKLVFAFLLVAYFVALVALVGEIIHKSMYGKKNKANVR